jgi:CDP-glucose 4,6-dehydratase
VRDYFYVRDAADAYLLLAERLTDEGVRGEAFNFGTETPMSVLDVVRMILRMLDGSPLEPIVLNEASREIPKQYLDCSKARRVLDWRPRHTLEEGLSETISWYKKHLGPKAPMLTY